MTIMVPLPHANQQPYDDLHDALAFLRVANLVIESSRDRGLDGESVADLARVLDNVRDLITPVIALLDQINPPDILKHYQECRHQILTRAKDRSSG